MKRRPFLALAILAGLEMPLARAGDDGVGLTQGLVGYWPLRGDAQDRSGRKNHGRSHGGAEQGSFDGRSSYVEIPQSPSMSFGKGDFTLCAWVWTALDTEDVVGDVITQYDPARRRGFNLSIKASSGGYSSQGDDRHVHLGIDDARLGEWEDCGRPRVYAVEAGKCVSSDRDLGPGWKHLAGIKRGGRLELFVDGRKACESAAFQSGDFDLTSGQPLLIGLGALDYFSGKIRQVRVYDRALASDTLEQLAKAAPEEP